MRRSCATGILPVPEHSQDGYGTPPVAAPPRCATSSRSGKCPRAWSDAMKLPREVSPPLLPAMSPLIPRVIGPHRIRGREAFAYILVLALAVVTLGVFLRWQIAHLHEQEMTSWQARVSSLADDRAHSVSDWLTERQADAQVFATHPSVRAALRAHYDAGQLSKFPPGSLPELMALLDTMAKSYSYAGVYILDRDGQVVMQSSRSNPLNPLFSETCRAVT